MNALSTSRDRSVHTQPIITRIAALSILTAAGTALAQDDTNGADRNFDLEFSLDIGSDTELSDPFADGDEVFDPGDIYRWRGMVLAGPSNGYRDDKGPYLPWIPTPEPGFAHPLGLPAVAPACDPSFPLQEILREYLDVDATDSIDEPIWEFIPRDRPLEQPIEFFHTPSIHFPKGLILSYDDDMAKPYPDCDIPTTVASPAGLTYGSTADRDEVIAYDLTGPIPLTPLASRGVANERQVHPSMAPNPFIGGDEVLDDDVDALDITEVGSDDQPQFPFWLWSVDHEAVGTMLSPMAIENPGHIYYYDGFVTGTLLRADIHFGLRDGVDIDAFEMIWLESPDGIVVLGAMFSVDEDDPTTPADESGGLDPAVIYASALTGTSFHLVDEPFRDDIDALAAWCEPLVEDPTWDPTPPCPADLAAPFGTLNFFDIAAYIALYNANDPAADLAAPFGTLNFFDIAAYIAAYNAGCP